MSNPTATVSAALTDPMFWAYQVVAFGGSLAALAARPAIPDGYHLTFGIIVGAAIVLTIQHLPALRNGGGAE
jgi:hypothetical protein